MPKKIVLVDDDESVRTMLTALFEQIGYAVVAFADAMTALCQLKKTVYHVLVTDAEMPGMSGEQLVREIRRLNILLPIIMISGNPNRESTARSAGVNYFFMKGEVELFENLRRTVGEIAKQNA